jgi:cell division protein FtsB
MSASSPRSVNSLPASTPLSRDEQLAQLREHLQQLQTQQEAIARQINTLEQ